MNDDKPVYLQIMEIIEDDIISGVYSPNNIIISTTQISKLYSVNPRVYRRRGKTGYYAGRTGTGNP